MAADLGAVARGAFDVDPAAHGQAAERGERQALLHHVEVGRDDGAGLAVQRRHGEAHALDRDAGADLEAGAERRVGEAQREGAQAGAVLQALDARQACDDAGEHGAGWPAPAAQKRNFRPTSSSAPLELRETGLSWSRRT